MMDFSPNEALQRALHYIASNASTPFASSTTLSQDEMLKHARALSAAEHAKDLRPLIASKITDLQYYDVLNMERAAAVCFWGRSGSWLLASYLDSHDDVVLLPTDRSEQIYRFFELHQLLSLHDKLIAYPIFWPNFFQGDFAIEPRDYYAAVAALFDVYGNSPEPLLQTRRAFFQFLHVAYRLALDRRPATPRPLMFYSQHFWDEQLARRFDEDFPRARFLHTVRDPITTYDRMFEFSLSTGRGADAPVWLLNHLVKHGQPHTGMESRTRAVRFEDLHNKTAETLNRVIDWLGLPHPAAELKSTFNGKPFVVERGGITWSGPRTEQTLRSSRNVASADQAMLFALLYENFIAWNYSVPRIFKYTFIRTLACMPVLLVPMKSEIIGAWATLKTQVLPSLMHGRIRFALESLFGIFKSRLQIIWLVVSELYRRLTYGKNVFELL